MDSGVAEPVSIDGGWDSAATLIDGRWIERRPRRAEVADRLRMETELMPWLAPQLPLDVPEPHVVASEPLVVRHALVVGEPISEPTAEHGRQLGAFLRALHTVDPAEAVRRGLQGPEEAARELAEIVERFRADVLPLVPVEHRGAARALLDTFGEFPTDTVVHGDLGPEHVLCQGTGLSGVIDFSDAHVGDGAIDLAWTLHGTPPEFATALAEEYGVTRQLHDRALLWHRLGPWYEVVHGLDNELPDDVRSGLDGVVRRLRD
ncbi:phosphotransferase [Saccharopolyspora sp. NPDC050389]|uniref:phosphotransferase family protein n=1 Tax=Saccharopolyspora sp. NPDC050389 TaxID=3155516 RepID=UPI0033E16BBE